MGRQFTTVEEYVGSLPPAAAEPFAQARAAIHAALPGAQEAVSYQILAFQVDGRSVLYLAGWKQHLSIYPLPEIDPDVDADLDRRLAAYRSGASTAKFPLGQPVPLDLITELVDRLAVR